MHLLAVRTPGYRMPRRTANERARMPVALIVKCVEALENTSEQVVNLLIGEPSKARRRII